MHCPLHKGSKSVSFVFEHMAVVLLDLAAMALSKSGQRTRTQLFTLKLLLERPLLLQAAGQLSFRAVCCTLCIFCVFSCADQSLHTGPVCPKINRLLQSR